MPKQATPTEATAVVEFTADEFIAAHAAAAMSDRRLTQYQQQDVDDAAEVLTEYFPNGFVPALTVDDIVSITGDVPASLMHNDELDEARRDVQESLMNACNAFGRPKVDVNGDVIDPGLRRFIARGDLMLPGGDGLFEPIVIAITCPNGTGLYESGVCNAAVVLYRPPSTVRVWDKETGERVDKPNTFADRQTGELKCGMYAPSGYVGLVARLWDVSKAIENDPAYPGATRIVRRLAAAAAKIRKVYDDTSPERPNVSDDPRAMSLPKKQSRC